MFHMINGNLPYGMSVVCLLSLSGLVLGNVALIKYIFFSKK